MTEHQHNTPDEFDRICQADHLERPLEYEKHGMHRTPEYEAWKSLRLRCYNVRNRNYHQYGGRGIKVCNRWCRSFLAFYEDMGPRPSSKHSIDRIDNEGNYEPGNCRWATQGEQSKNKRTTVRLEHDGKKMILKEWAQVAGMKVSTLRRRLESGLPISEALTTPIKQRRVAHPESNPVVPGVQFKTAPGFSMYRIGDNETVWTCWPRRADWGNRPVVWKELSRCGSRRPGQEKRLQVQLVDDFGRRHYPFIHKLVLEAFK